MTSVSELPVEEPKTLIDELLKEQRSLTAVSRFSRFHEESKFPLQYQYYRDLIPLSTPAVGEQYAFEVDLDQCSGCKGCVTACHALNGLEDEEAWRDVGQLAGAVHGEALQQTVTTACHHCVDPGCMNGCPVLAYDKDPLTGIVRHLDDQCIGCQYCVMKCPYDVPKFSERLGIVRKCDMCSQRLGAGEAPACVQACPNEAIKITIIEQQSIKSGYRYPETGECRGYSAPDFDELAAELSEFDRTNNFLPGTPSPDYTLPTTLFKTNRPGVAALRAADESALKPQHAHWALVFLLVFSQASLGLLFAAMSPVFGGGGVSIAPLCASAGFMGLALGLATFHLGRPMKAWRVFLGWRKSWFSREAIAFGGYINALAVGMVLWFLGQEALLNKVLPVALLLGVISVFCSVMLYVDTHREFWSVYHTGTRFVGTTVLLGFVGWLAAGIGDVEVFNGGLITIAGLSLAKLFLEGTVFLHARTAEWTPLKRSALLMLGPMRVATGFRCFVLLVGGALFPLLGIIGTVPATADLMFVVFVLLLAGELAERYLFFTAVSPTQMPGGFHS